MSSNETMLPQPATAYRSKYRHGGTPSSGSFSTSFLSSGLAVSSRPHSVLDRLRTRARLTNLAVCLIVVLFSFSLLESLNFYLVRDDVVKESYDISTQGVGRSYFSNGVPPSIEATI